MQRARGRHTGLAANPACSLARPTTALKRVSYVLIPCQASSQTLRPTCTAHAAPLWRVSASDLGQPIARIEWLLVAWRASCASPPFQSGGVSALPRLPGKSRLPGGSRRCHAGPPQGPVHCMFTVHVPTLLTCAQPSAPLGRTVPYGRRGRRAGGRARRGRSGWPGGWTARAT